MRKLPNGWQWSTIGEVADVQLGRQRSPKNHSGPHTRPYLRSANVTWEGIDLSDVKEMNFEPSEAATFELQPGDLLLNEASGSPNEVGKPAIWSGEIPGCCFQNTLLRVRSRGPLTSYLCWYCRWAALDGRFGEAGRGVNIRHLGKAGLASFPMPLPPRAEQERIVAAIEERLSLLQAACGGLRSVVNRLDSLEQRCLDAAADRRWPRAQLGELLDAPLANGRSVRTRPGGFPVLRLTALQDRRVLLVERKGGAWTREEAEPYLVRRDDFLVSRGSGSLSRVGRGGLVDVDPDPVAFPDTLIRVRARKSALLPEYLQIVWESSDVRRQIEGAARTTAGIYKISQGVLRAIELPNPPVERQRSLAAEVGSALTVLRRVRAQVNKSQLRCSAVQHGVLAAAFSGQLIRRDRGRVATATRQA